MPRNFLARNYFWVVSHFWKIEFSKSIIKFNFQKLFLHKLCISIHRERLEEAKGVTRKREEQMDNMAAQHRKELANLVGKSEGASNDVIQMLERRCQEAEENLAGKSKVLEVLQSEIGDKERQILEQGSLVKSVSEKLEMSQEQCKGIQEQFVAKEEEWKEERTNLEAKIVEVTEKHETEMAEKSSAINSLQSAISQYESAYNQASSQYTTLLENYETMKSEFDQARTDLESTKSELEQTKADHVEKERIDSEAHEKAVEELKSLLVEKEKEMEELNSKSEAKFNKVKGQAKAKIKALEEELEELKKVWLVYCCWCFVLFFVFHSSKVILPCDCVWPE